CVAVVLMLADGTSIEVIAEIDVVAFDDHDAMIGIVVDAAVVICLREGEALVGQDAAEDAVDAGEDLGALAWRQVARGWARDAPPRLRRRVTRAGIQQRRQSLLTQRVSGLVEGYYFTVIVALDATD